MNNDIRNAAFRLKAAHEELERAAAAYFKWQRPDSNLAFDALREAYEYSLEIVRHDEHSLSNLVLQWLESEGKS